MKVIVNPGKTVSALVKTKEAPKGAVVSFGPGAEIEIEDDEAKRLFALGFVTSPKLAPKAAEPEQEATKEDPAKEVPAK